MGQFPGKEWHSCFLFTSPAWERLAATLFVTFYWDHELLGEERKENLIHWKPQYMFGTEKVKWQRERKNPRSVSLWP